MKKLTQEEKRQLAEKIQQERNRQSEVVRGNARRNDQEIRKVQRSFFAALLGGLFSFFNE